jgi:hypothetical protein
MPEGKQRMLELLIRVAIMCGIKAPLEHRKEQQADEKEILDPILVLMRREYSEHLVRTLQADRPPAKTNEIEYRQ